MTINRVRFFRDGIGFNDSAGDERATLRLSNIPSNINWVTSSLWGACLAIGSYYIFARSAPTNYDAAPHTRYTDYYYRSNENGIYQLRVADITSHFISNFSIPLLNDSDFIARFPGWIRYLLVDVPRLCGGTQINNPALLMQNISTIAELSNRDGTHYPAATLLHAANYLREQFFESCITSNFRHMLNHIDRFTEAYTSANKHEEVSNLELYIFLCLEFVILLGIIGYMAYKRSLPMFYNPVLSNTPEEPNYIKLAKIHWPYELIPKEYLCGISREIMDYPVRTSAGVNSPACPSYEHACIQRWLMVAKIDPYVRIPISYTLTPDEYLKEKINIYVKDKVNNMSLSLFNYNPIQNNNSYQKLIYNNTPARKQKLM
jgi:hypothetical protein